MTVWPVAINISQSKLIISSKLYLSQQSSDVMGGIIWQSVVLRGNKKQPRCDRDWMLSARGNWSLRLLGAGKKDKYAAGNSRGKRKIRGGHWGSKQNQIQMEKISHSVGHRYKYDYRQQLEASEN